MATCDPKCPRCRELVKEDKFNPEVGRHLADHIQHIGFMFSLSAAAGVAVGLVLLVLWVL